MKRRSTLSLKGKESPVFYGAFRMFTALLLICWSSTMLMAQTIAPQEVEPNGTSGTATAITTNPAKIRGYIYPNADEDWYSFSATAGDKVYAAVMTSFSSSGGVDGQLRLWASNGIMLIENDDNDGTFGSTAPTIAGATIPSTGTYYLQVKPMSTTNQLRPYDLYLQVKSGSPTAEVESNNTTGTANALPGSGWVSGTRDPAGDIDFYAVTLAAGETVFLSLDLDPERDNVQWDGRLGFALFGNNNDVTLPANDGSAGSVANPLSEAFFFTVKDAGTYYVVVDAPAAGTGGPTATYNLSVSRFLPTTGYVNYASTNVPQAIPTGPGVVTSTLTIADSKLIKDLSVRINLDHTFMADLDVHLTAPNGAEVALFTDIGSVTSGTETTLDFLINDNCAIPSSFALTRPMAVTPELNAFLDYFKGVNTQGVWTLTIRDDATGDGGTLNSWSLEVLEDNTPATVAGYSTVFSTDFESGDAGFMHSGTQDEWERGLPSFAPITTANSGVNCWKTDLDNGYNASADQLLESGDLDLTALTGPIVASWAMKYHMESASFDGLEVYVEEVGNPSNTQLLFRWYGATMNSTVGNPGVIVPLAGGWGTYFGDISAFAGKIVRFKVRLFSDTTVQLAGVAIDDVKILSLCPDLTSAPANVTITNSTCSSPTCVPDGGFFTAPVNACPSGSTLQYSVGGGSWSSTLPSFDQTGVQSIRTRCSCNNDVNNVSPPSIAVETDPGPCPPECTCPAPTGECVMSSTIDLDADCSVTRLAATFVTNLSELPADLTIEVSRELAPAGSGVYGSFGPGTTFTGLDLANITECTANGSSAVYGIKIRLTNSCGNSSTIDCQITLRDLIFPELANCPSNTTVNTTVDDECTGTANWTHPSASDNCAVLCRNYQIEKEINGNFVVVNASGTPTPGFLTAFVDGAAASLDVSIGELCTDNTYRIRYYIRDVHGNPSFPVATPQCEFIITVVCPSTQYTVTGGGARCTTDNVGPVVGLSDSEIGTNYQLFLGANPVGAPVPGTGNAISFGPQLAVGTYTVVATVVDGGCQTNMTGSAVVSTFNCSVTISDPCVCLDNATTLTNGQFGEQIKVNAPSSQTWTVTTVSGLYKTTSAAPPTAPSPITVGTVLANIGGNMFTLDGRHVDAIGYTITVTNGQGTVFSIGNSCSYPNPVITSDLSGPFCLYSDPITLTGNPGDANTDPMNPPFFTVNGVPATTFDPGAGLGTYVIEYNVDGGIPKAAGPNDPGCEQSVSQTVTVVATPSNLVCNDLVTVALDASCTLELNADQVLEGSYACYDDYIVELDRSLPLGNGPWAPGILG
ncbi:MAG: proprotein convertase P-domain-containing protein, partial [Saprospiraceae bacterium]|nr:proprotein convertase P-domain-containing protein [Saprospiraceae bacterium]